MESNVRRFLKINNKNVYILDIFVLNKSKILVSRSNITSQVCDTSKKYTRASYKIESHDVS